MMQCIHEKVSAYHHAVLQQAELLHKKNQKSDKHWLVARHRIGHQVWVLMAANWPVLEDLM